MAKAKEKGNQNGKQKVGEKKQMSPPAHQSKGPMVVNGRTAPKGKCSAKGQTKRQVNDLMMQNQAKAHESLRDTSMPTPCKCRLWYITNR